MNCWVGLASGPINAVVNSFAIAFVSLYFSFYSFIVFTEGYPHGKHKWNCCLLSFVTYMCFPFPDLIHVLLSSFLGSSFFSFIGIL